MSEMWEMGLAASYYRTISYVHSAKKQWGLDFYQNLKRNKNPYNLGSMSKLCKTVRYTKKKRLQDLFSRFQFKCRKRISISFQSTSSNLCPSHPTLISLHYSAFKRHQMTLKRLKLSKMDSERTIKKRHKDAKNKSQNVKITKPTKSPKPTKPPKPWKEAQCQHYLLYTTIHWSRLSVHLILQDLSGVKWADFE